MIRNCKIDLHFEMYNCLSCTFQKVNYISIKLFKNNVKNIFLHVVFPSFLHIANP